MTASLHPANPSTADTAAPWSPLQSLLQGAAFASLAQTGWIKITGDDRVRWLNGMTTNSIQQLQPGEGNYNLLLSAQGRIQGDAYAFALPDGLLLETSRAQVVGLMELLDRFIIMDDVLLEDISTQRHGLLCAGPLAAASLAALGIEAAAGDALQLRIVMWGGFEVTLVNA